MRTKNNDDPEAVAQAVQAASSAIDYVSAVQAMADGGVLPAQGKPIAVEELQEHYAAKGKKGHREASSGALCRWLG